MDKEMDFIGKITEKKFNNGGSILKLSLSPEDLAKVNSGGWLNINIRQSKKGNWYGERDTWEPNRMSAQPASSVKPSDDSDLPF